MTRKSQHFGFIKSMAYSSVLTFGMVGAAWAQSSSVAVEQAEPDVQIKQQEPQVRIVPSEENAEVSGLEGAEVRVVPPEDQQASAQEQKKDKQGKDKDQQASAQGQQSGQGQQGQQSAQSGQSQQSGQQGQQQLAQHKDMLGRELVGSDNQSYGEVDAILRDRESGELHAVIGFDSDAAVSVPVSEIQKQGEQLSFKSQSGEEQLATLELDGMEEVEVEEESPLG